MDFCKKVEKSVFLAAGDTPKAQKSPPVTAGWAGFGW
jgi:hypothetical protein